MKKFLFLIVFLAVVAGALQSPGSTHAFVSYTSPNTHSLNLFNI